MNKSLKIALNILIFLLIAGFGYYMIRSMMSNEQTVPSDEENTESTFVSPYKKMISFDADSEINCFAVSGNAIYAALSDQIAVFDLSGKPQHDFAIDAGVCDILVDEATIFVSYPRRMDLFTLDGTKKNSWKACSDN
jgi:hypothetical protein